MARRTIIERIFYVNIFYTQSKPNVTRAFLAVIIDLETFEILFFDDMEILYYFIDGLSSNCIFYGHEIYQFYKIIVPYFRNKYTIEVFATSMQHAFYFDFFAKDDENKFIRFFDVQKLLKDIPESPFDEELPIFNSNFTEKHLDIAINYSSELTKKFIDFCIFYDLDLYYFSFSIYTQTSILKRFLHEEMTKLKINDNNLVALYNLMAKQNAPQNKYIWALRRSCLNGGLAFISAKHAGKAVKNVYAYDIKSMYHIFINILRVPVGFQVNNKRLYAAMNYIKNASINNFSNPFNVYFNAKIIIRNLRAKKNSVFKKNGIFTISENNFVEKDIYNNYDMRSTNNILRVIRSLQPIAYSNAKFAFGKLYEADSVTIYVNELEYYIISRVYDFDDVLIEYGEITTNSAIPPDYITMASNMLFSRKEKDPEHYKTLYNALFGILLQNDFYENFSLDKNGNIFINKDDLINFDNLDDLIAKNMLWKLSEYGSRIAGMGRVYLVSIIELLQKYEIYDGDTDSIFTNCPPTDFEMIQNKLYNKLRKSFSISSEHRKKYFYDLVSDMRNCGHFEYKNFYNDYKAIAVKTRIGKNKNGLTITCAGLPEKARKLYEKHGTFEDFNAGLQFNEKCSYYYTYNFFSVGHKIKLQNDLIEFYRARNKHKAIFIVSADLNDYHKNKILCELYNNDYNLILCEFDGERIWKI